MFFFVFDTYQLSYIRSQPVTRKKINCAIKPGSCPTKHCALIPQIFQWRASRKFAALCSGQNWAINILRAIFDCEILSGPFTYRSQWDVTLFKGLMRWYLDYFLGKCANVCNLKVPNVTQEESKFNCFKLTYNISHYMRKS